MTVRWPDSPQPLSMTLEIDGKTYTINDPTRKTLESRIDVYPGESRLLDVTFRIEGEAECYGWNNSSYFCTPKYKNSKWQLPKGNYLIDVTVYSAGEICRGVFRLNNDFESKDFRLEAASKDEQALVEKIRKEEMARGI